MGREILFSVLLAGALLMGLLLATMSRSRGWKGFIQPFLWVGVVIVIWGLVSVHLPR